MAASSSRLQHGLIMTVDINPPRGDLYHIAAEQSEAISHLCVSENISRLC